jgi:hypothetical protein
MQQAFLFNNKNDSYNDGMAALDVLTKTQELINFLLRYVVAGGSAVLAFGLTQQNPFSFLRVGTELSPLLLLLFVSVIGPAIYSIHRAALHPLILVFMLMALTWRKKLKKEEVKRHEWWKLDRSLAKAKEKWRTTPTLSGLLSTYEAWAAQIHYLYCSAFGTGFAVVLACYFNPTPNHIKPILTISLLLFGAALVSDWRATGWQIERTIEDATCGLTK